MSICSKHREPRADCRLCQLRAEDVLPGWAEKLAEARAAGTCDCPCGFTYYRTASRCPRCGLATPAKGGA